MPQNMDPFLSWIRVDDSANLAINSPPKPKPPSSALSHGAAIYGLFGHEAQFRAAFKALSPTPAPRKRVLTTEITPDMRSKARRAAFDEEEDMSCVSYEPKKRFDIARCGSAIAPRGSSRPNRAGVRFVHNDVSVCCNPIRKHASSSSEDLHHGIGTRALHRSIA